MDDFETMTPAAAKKYILQGGDGKIFVDGELDLSNSRVKEIQAAVRCYDLDASNTKLHSLPADLTVESTITLRGCQQLEFLPSNLKCGSLDLQGCTFLSNLPEGLECWFINLNNCSRFVGWPKSATVHRGIVSLRNCIEVQTLPAWFGDLAQLDLAGCVQLKRIPGNFSVSGWLDIGGASIETLPDSLRGKPLRWRGVRIDERIAFEPESISSKEVLNEPNTELRRVMIERMGYLKFAQEAGAKTLDKDTDPGGERKLLKIKMQEGEDIVGLTCSCPSTARHYFLRVPPNVSTCHQAAAWLAGFDDPEKYCPVIET